MKKLLNLICLSCFIMANAPTYAVTKVPTDTTIPLTVTHRATSKNVISGGTIDATVDEDVKVNGKVVFKKGANATISVLSTKKAGFVGIPGEMVLCGGKVSDVNGNLHKVDFNRQITGEEKTWPKALLSVSIFFLWPLALCGFVKGGQAELNSSSTIDAKLSNEFSL